MPEPIVITLNENNEETDTADEFEVDMVVTNKTDKIGPIVARYWMLAGSLLYVFSCWRLFRDCMCASSSDPSVQE